MKLLIFSSLLTSVFSVKCNWQTPSYKLDKDGALIDFNVDWPGIEFPVFFDCGWGVKPDSWACGSTKFEGSFTKTEKNWFTGQDETSSWSYESEIKGCTHAAVCDKLAGGADGCQKATYTYEKWIPRTCNADEDFHAITEDFSTTLTLSCCNTDYCNANEDYSNCVAVGTFATYINELNQCWNDYKRTFMTELLCDNDGVPNRDILSFGENCTEEDGSWKAKRRKDIECRYKPTCAAELREKLTEFGNCACGAATNNDYTGDFIGTAMQNNWQRFCPNITLECGIDNAGIVKILYNYWKIKYRFLVKLGKDLIDSDKLEALKAKIAELLNLDPITITIKIDVSVSTTRRLLQDETGIVVEVQADDEGTKEYIQGNMNSNLATNLAGTAGADVTMTSVESEEASETTEGSSEGNQFNVSIISLITVFGFVAAMFN